METMDMSESDCSAMNESWYWVRKESGVLMLNEGSSYESFGKTEKMLAFLEQWEASAGQHTDNLPQFVFLFCFKLVMDACIFCLCCRKLHSSFFNMCSLSILLCDMSIVVCITAVWFLGVDRSPVLPCSLLAHVSAMFAVLPLPILCLGALDYWMEDSYRLGKKRTVYIFLRNVTLVLLVWTLACLHSYFSTNTQMMVLNYEKGARTLACEVQESKLVQNLNVGLFIIAMATMALFWSRIPQWQTDSTRITTLRLGAENQSSDLFTKTPSTDVEIGEDNYLEENAQPRLPLWVSMTLSFSENWLSFLAMFVTGQCLGVDFPAYISVNLLWCECTNSWVSGVVFWLKSRFYGPYSHLPENVCLWEAQWHLSKGISLNLFSPNPKRGTKLGSNYKDSKLNSV